MQNEKHYFLINGTVKVSDSKMPEKRIVQHKDYNQKFEDYKYKTFYDNWLFYLQPCEIDDWEIGQLLTYFYTNNKKITDNPIDITEIVFEKYGKIYFKQPTEKQYDIHKFEDYKNIIDKQCDEHCFYNCSQAGSIAPQCLKPTEKQVESDLIKYLDDCILSCEISAEDFKKSKMEMSYLCSNAMKQAYINVKNEIFKNR